MQYLPKTVNNHCQNVYNVLLCNLQNNPGLGTWKSQAGQVEKAVEYAIKVTAKSQLTSLKSFFLQKD